MPRHLAPTRREILITLRKRGKLSASELADCLGVTSVAVRHHLVHLQAADLVEHHVERRPVGRPVTVYALTKEADELFPKSYEDLATTLLCQIAELDGEEKIQQIFRARAAHVEEKYRSRIDSNRIEQRVASLTSVLTEDGALAEWQPVDGGYELCVYNCLLSKISSLFPQACSEELGLLNRVLDTKVTRIEHMASGGRRCAYLIKAR